MEINKFKAKGSEIFSIYAPGMYIFHNNYYGILAIAKLDKDKTDRKKHHSHYTICANSAKTRGGSLQKDEMETIVKSYIRKDENKQIPTSVDFDVIDDELNHIGVNIDITDYDHTIIKTNL